LLKAVHELHRDAYRCCLLDTDALGRETGPLTWELVTFLWSALVSFFLAVEKVLGLEPQRPEPGILKNKGIIVFLV
jgi:hypothetical protein